ncbi:hypothetical protein CRE_14228 [Caenorhabditis remanei]|uniref:Uncharacterized protein n=1 Tax=Caenorhabditis remanei TaxID=31234 RepID=E3N1L2_CAERE|nr:hypothetical protein CRE_14228 [Caenorhabditis remanei]
MNLISTLVNGITEYLDSGPKKYHMDHGYKMRKIPRMFKILENASDFKALESTKGGQRISLTLAPEGFERVNPKSLEFIREMLLSLFTHYPDIQKELEAPFPRNTIAVSFSEFNFQVGKSCQKFSPALGSKTGFLTYQKLSPNIQATYYNEKEECFLAGVCYYPVLIGKAKCFENDRAAIHLARASSEPFPLQDREKSYKKVMYKGYGRYCSIAKKRVTLDCSGKYVRHLEYDHFWNTYIRTPCEECLVDSVTYKWKGPKEEASTSSAASTSEVQQTIRETPILSGSDLSEKVVELDLPEQVEEVMPSLNTATLDSEDREESEAAEDSGERASSPLSSVGSLLNDYDQFEDASSDFESDIDAEVIG